MGDEGVVFIGVAGKVMHRMIKNSREEMERLEREREKEQEQERTRRNIPCNFNEYLSSNDFESIVHQECNRIRRVTTVQVTGCFIYGEFVSHSGLSRYSFEIDFNDYGKVTGKYWLIQENEDSTIPTVIANNIRKRLLEYYSENGLLEDREFIEIPW